MVGDQARRARARRPTSACIQPGIGRTKMLASDIERRSGRRPSRPPSRGARSSWRRRRRRSAPPNQASISADLRAQPEAPAKASTTCCGVGQIDVSRAGRGDTGGADDDDADQRSVTRKPTIKPAMIPAIARMSASPCWSRRYMRPAAQGSSCRRSCRHWDGAPGPTCSCESSQARNRKQGATSLGWPGRPIGVVLAELLDLLLRRAAAGVERGPDRPRRDRVDADPLADQILGERAGEGGDRALGRAVVEQLLRALDRR